MTPDELNLVDPDVLFGVRELLSIRVAYATACCDESMLTSLLDSALKLDEKVHLSIFEAVLQTHLFCGFPKTIFALRLMHKVGFQPPTGIDELRSTNDILSDGEALCSQIYGQSYTPLREMMGSLHPDFDRWMVMTGYGRVLSRPGLDARERELCVLPVLCEQHAWPQLQSHAAGARRCGANEREVWASLSIWACTAAKAEVDLAIRNVIRALQRV